MSTAILVIWTVVAVSGHQYGERTPYKDWRPIGEFSSMRACENAGRLLGKPAEQVRCLPIKETP